MNVVAYIREFGVKIFVSKTIRKCFYKSQSKLAWKINSYNENLIEAYLAKEFQNSYVDMDKELQYKKTDVPDKPIWIMWWQGEREAPEVVKCCINSVRRNSNGHRVIVITESNVMDYIKLPAYIYDKFEKGFITRTHLSDMIRLNLLYLYGGAWLDATVFVSQNIPESIFGRTFYSSKIGVKTKDPSHGRWTTFLLFGQKGHKFFRKVLEYHYRYWLKHDMIVDYIMFDYIINYVTKYDEECNQLVKELPLNNQSIFELRKKLNEPFETWDIRELDSNTIFNKLSYKENFIKKLDGIQTIYGRLIEEYL